MPEEHRKKIIEYASNALENGILEPSRSKYNSPVFLVPKKGGKMRVVIDYRKVNELSRTFTRGRQSMTAFWPSKEKSRVYFRVLTYRRDFTR